jgi:hypothetical protein
VDQPPRFNSSPRWHPAAAAKIARFQRFRSFFCCRWRLTDAAEVYRRLNPKYDSPAAAAN